MTDLYYTLLLPIALIFIGYIYSYFRNCYAFFLKRKRKKNQQVQKIKRVEESIGRRIYEDFIERIDKKTIDSNCVNIKFSIREDLRGIYVYPNVIVEIEMINIPVSIRFSLLLNSNVEDLCIYYNKNLIGEDSFSSKEELLEYNSKLFKKLLILIGVVDKEYFEPKLADEDFIRKYRWADALYLFRLNNIEYSPNLNRIHNLCRDSELFRVIYSYLMNYYDIAIADVDSDEENTVKVLLEDIGVRLYLDVSTKPGLVIKILNYEFDLNTSEYVIKEEKNIGFIEEPIENSLYLRVIRSIININSVRYDTDLCNRLKYIITLYNDR